MFRPAAAEWPSNVASSLPNPIILSCLHSHPPIGLEAPGSERSIPHTHSHLMAYISTSCAQSGLIWTDRKTDHGTINKFTHWAEHDRLWTESRSVMTHDDSNNNNIHRKLSSLTLIPFSSLNLSIGGDYIHLNTNPCSSVHVLFAIYVSSPSVTLVRAIFSLAVS